MKTSSREEQLLQLTAEAMLRLRSLGLASTAAESFLHLKHGTFPNG